MILKIAFLLLLYATSPAGLNPDAYRLTDIDSTPGKAGYRWKQLLPFGHGSFQEDWKPGTFPLGITPVKAFNENLWMIGQKSVWSSDDGRLWVQHKKADWGERIYQNYVYFNNRLWMFGGMRYNERQLTNDIWSSADGTNWEPSAQASWSPRKGQAMIVFKNKLWLFGGAANISLDFVSSELLQDAWSSEDGFHWTLQQKTSSWPPRENANLVVLRDTLYMIGGSAKGDIWRSSDAVNWEQVTPEVNWKQRYDYGTLVFDHKIWVFGGRDNSSNHTRAARNDVWYSTNATTWTRLGEHAPWTVRSGANSIIYKNKLWIYSGKHTGGPHNWGGDIWIMAVNKD